MSQNIQQILIDFLQETKYLTEQIDKLNFDTAKELYSLYDEAANASTQNIASIDAELRAELCARQDAILERLIDFAAPASSGLRVFTPAVQGYRQWGNTELLKDKGLTGVMLARKLGAKPTMMFCSKPGDYPYLQVFPELELLYAENTDAELYYRHLHENYKRMDIIILHGMYAETIGYLNEYRKLRPDGKVYCGLDMNRHWMSRIDWGMAEVRKFAGQCDVIATSCTALRDALNRNPKVSFPCRWIPNGFYETLPAVADTNRKKNVILTVGRIGTEQKNNGELLLAFAEVAKRLPGWSLRLVGPVEPAFNESIALFFKRYPNLKNRVTFTGAISDKSDLYSEYAAAKIFVLTSTLEGGTPNVYSEALLHGCKFITSDIDASDDITNFGKLGIKYKLGDKKALTRALLKLCDHSGENEMAEHIPLALEYGRRYFDWERIGLKLRRLLAG
jgi:glycosyltransferase involved in cell wall biosynthesis